MQAGVMSSSTDRGILRRLEESNTPNFRKTLTLSMLRRTERLEIPVSFLQEHGDRIYKVLSLTGRNGRLWSVPLQTRTCATRHRDPPRVFLGRAWNGFAKENGFQLGDEVFFWLVASSTFHVFVHSPKFLPTATTEPNKNGEDYGTIDDSVTSESALRHSISITNHDDIEIPSGHIKPAVAHVPEALSRPRSTSSVRKEEYTDYPGLNSAIHTNSRFPQFLKKIMSNNLSTKHTKALEIPFAFVREHGDNLQEHVTLLGGSGHLRVVDLRVTTCRGQGRVHLGKGWKDFSLEHRFSEGDVLLFSLVGSSTFVVKMFSRASKLS